MSLKVKLLSVAAMICLVVGVLLVGIFAAETISFTMQGSINYEVPFYFDFADNGDGTVTLTAFKKDLNPPTDIVIPATVSKSANGSWMDGDDYTVTSIAEATSSSSGVFYNSNITSIEIPSTIESIGNYAFYGCRNLTEINYNAISVTDLSSSNRVFSYAGQNGNGITVNFGDGVKSIPAYLFYPYSSTSYSPNITNVNFSSTITSIGGYAFRNCSSLSGELDLSNTDLENIGAYAFYNCSGFSNINLPSSLDGIGSYAFGYCSGLASITLPTNLTSIGNYAFYDCSNLIEINYNALSLADLSSNNRVFSYAGQDGDGITVNFGDGVERIPAYLFYPYFSTSYSPNITNVNFSSTITSIGSYAFGYCSSLSGELDLSNTDLENIGDYAFYNCSGFSNINFPSSLVGIGRYAFSDCSNLESLTLPTNLTSIGEYAFSDCSNLIEINYNALFLADLSSDNRVFLDAGNDGNGITVNFGEGIKSIPAYLFCPYSSTSASPNITNVNFSSTITSIGSYAFGYCSRLTSITFPSNLTSIGEYAFVYCSSLTSITLPSNLTSIGEYAFSYCFGLTNITFPSNLTSIGEYVFYCCRGLTSIDLSNYTNLTSIGRYAFSQCYGLTSVTLPSSLRNIERSAFNNCFALAEVYNYSSLTIIEGSSSYGSVGEYAKVVYNASDLRGEKPESRIQTIKNVQYYVFREDFIALAPAVARDSLTTLKLDSKTTEISSQAFWNNNVLTNIDLSNCTSLTSIGVQAFEDCSELTSIDLSNCTNLTSIGSSAFHNCSGLTNITLPSSLETIGDSAFYGCSELTSINLSNCTNLTSIGSSAFSDCRGLTSITFPSSLETIGDSAFSYCSGLTSIDLSNCTNLTSIGSSAFRYCSRLTNITLPSSLETIGDSAFRNCSGLTSIDLSNCTNLTSIGRYAFNNCSELTSITFPNTAGWYCTTSSSATTGTEMNMSNPTQNATWLTAGSGEEYYGYYFKRNA